MGTTAAETKTIMAEILSHFSLLTIRESEVGSTPAHIPDPEELKRVITEKIARLSSTKNFQIVSGWLREASWAESALEKKGGEILGHQKWVGRKLKLEFLPTKQIPYLLGIHKIPLRDQNPTFQIWREELLEFLEIATSTDIADLAKKWSKGLWEKEKPSPEKQEEIEQVLRDAAMAKQTTIRASKTVIAIC